MGIFISFSNWNQNCPLIAWPCTAFDWQHISKPDQWFNKRTKFAQIYFWSYLLPQKCPWMGNKMPGNNIPGVQCRKYFSLKLLVQHQKYISILWQQVWFGTIHQWSWHKDFHKLKRQKSDIVVLYNSKNIERLLCGYNWVEWLFLQ